MRKCHACQGELDSAAVTGGKCPHCGAILHKLAQRTIEDKRSLRDPQAPSDGKDAEGSDDSDADASLELEVFEIGAAEPTIEVGQSDTAGETGEADAGAAEPEKASGPGRKAPTVGDQADATIHFDLISDLPEDDKKKATRRSTHTLESDRTIDLDMTSDEARHISSQWRGTFDHGSHLGRTIKQRETVTGFRSSLPVKSRYVRERRKAGGPPPTTPAEVPDYELLDIIGEGGMGVVYAAHQSSIARTVAVKMLKPSAKEREGQRDKFISEAVVTGELDHPNIVPIYDLGANDEGALFYSMKRVRGTPWDKVIHQKSLDENLSILMRVADAVAFAHAGGVIHRDLKPENVMLGDFGEVLVMDWGLARITPEFAHVNTVYQTDSLGGTPAYMAPEMAKGPIDAINKTSDVYLLGALLYEIIGGQPPHSGRDVMQCLMAASQNRIDPIRYDGELKAIALKAMATRQEDRYQTVKEFQEAIRTYQSHSESLVLTAHANQNLQKARAMATEGKNGERAKEAYQLFARALYGFQESLALWDGNHRARGLLTEAQRDYAKCALGHGDLDLAASLLDAGKAEHHELSKQIDVARTERDARQRRLQRAKQVVAALAVSVVIIISVSLVAVNAQRQKAVIARNDAIEAQKQEEEQKRAAIAAQKGEAKARTQAERDRDAAEKAKKEEELAKKDAIKQRDAAEKAKKEEELAKKDAIKQRDAAEKAKEAEKIAKEREQYEAYIAQIGLAAAKIDENAYDFARVLLQDSEPDRRHWEWGRLFHLCRLGDKVFDATEPVDSLAYSPDGKSFVTGDRAGQVTVRDAQTGAARWQKPHGQYVYSVNFSPDGRHIASGSSDSTVKIFDAATGAELRTLEGHKDGVLTVRFSPDGRQLLSGSYDYTARLWDLASRAVLQEFKYHSWWVWSAEFSPDGQRIVTAGQDGKAIVWQKEVVSRQPAAVSPQSPAPSPEPLYTRLTEFHGHDGAIYSAAFSPDGKLLATGGYDKMVMIWNPDETQQIDIKKRLDDEPEPEPNFLRLRGHSGPVRSVAFSPNGQLALSGSEDNTVRVWDVETGDAVKALRGHGKSVRACVFSPDGRSVLSGGEDKQARVWDVQGYEEVRVLHATVFAGHEDAVLSARYSRDGQRIVTASRDRTARLWNAATGQSIVKFDEGHEFLVSGAVFLPDGQHLATGAGDNTVRIWDLTGGTEKAVLYPTGRIGAVAVSPDGQWIATGAIGTEVQLWRYNANETADGEANQELKPVAKLAGHTKEVSALAFSPDGNRLASGGYGRQIRLWRRENNGAETVWTLERELVGHSGSITSLRFTPDGSRLISSSGDYSCAQWDVATGAEFRDLVLRHPDWVSSMDISPDAALAVTTCDDGVARLWRLADARLLAAEIAPGSAEVMNEVAKSSPAGRLDAEQRQRLRELAFNATSFSPDGSRVVLTSAGANEVRLWDVSAAMAAGPQNPPQQLSQPLLNDGDSKKNPVQVWAAQFAPNGRHVLTVGGNDAQLWNLDDGKVVIRYSPHGAVASAAVSPDGKLLATGSWDQSAKIWDAATGRAVRKLVGHAGYINSVEFSPDGRELLTASDDGTARLWDIATGKLNSKGAMQHASRILAAAYSRDATRVLTVSGDKTARVWNRATEELELTLEGHEWAVLSGQFSRDGERIITGSQDETAKIWDARTGKMLLSLEGHTAAITSVALSRDGRRALTGSQDNIAKVWDADTGKEILSLPGHSQEVTSVSFSPDGRHVLTSSRDGKAIIWLAEDWRKAAPDVASTLRRP